MAWTASGRSALILAAGLLLCLSGPVRAIEYTDGQTANATEEIESPGKPVALNKFTKSRARAKLTARSAGKSRRSRGVLAHGYRRKPMDPKTVVSRASVAKRDLRTNASNDDKADLKVSDATAIDDDAPDAVISQVAGVDRPLPDNVANANAQWPAPNGAAPAQAAPATRPASADQLSDADRTLNETPAATAVEAPVEPQAQVIAQSAPEPRAQPAQDKLMSAMAQAEQPSASSSDSAWDQSSNIGKIFIAIGGLLTFASAIRMFMT